ncbi:Bug family tripartite tricarboxylate transporter substrate binding protein [Candidimonas nitroreducens]|uniref:ABC transporter substrate-binding protein n=1 Tax=Candidimonas nitroreducens TaxID=683354 RepID=A0A225M4E4_9BURK|nr:tripartite tricarboxylate transporter substrate binding protein [Candidimonas nitroreducens]OWT56167.1 hypothetical protein CEY11_19240 [Candidimonas nitroreducens]
MRNHYRLLLLMAVAILPITNIAHAATSFPDSPVRIVVPTSPGGASDTSARILAEGLQTLWKQPVIVENKTGASGTIGARFVAKSPADGHTLFFGTGSTHVVAPLMLADTPYDPERDFTPLAIVGYAPFVLFVRSGLPVSNLRELVEYARKPDSELSFGTTGPATIYEIAARLLEHEAHIHFNHIPYKGLAPMAMDVAAGRVDIGVGPVDGYLKNDRLKVLAALGNQRVAAFPGVPTSTESGYPGFSVPAWAALWGPAALPANISSALTQGLLNVLGQPEVQKRIAVTGIVIQPGDGNALRMLIEHDLTKLKQLEKPGN